MLKKLFFIICFGTVLNACTKDTTEKENPSLSKIQEIELAYKSKEIADKFLQENLKINWSQNSFNEKEEKLTFSTSLKKQLNNKNSTLTYKYALLAIPNSGKWDFELKKFLTLEEIDIEDFNSNSLQNFTGTIYTYSLDGTLKKVESYEHGDLIEETSGKAFKRIDAFKYEKPRWDQPTGCMTLVTTETWEDNWYIGSTGGAITSIRYTGSRLVNIQYEYVNTCTGVDPDDYPYNSGGVYRFHDHFDAPHGPNGSSYVHPDDRVIENTGPEETIQVNRTDDFLNNDKINCTYEQLLKGTSIAKILVDFFGEDAIFDVTFNVVEDLNCRGKTDASGCNTPLGSNKYRIDIDKDYINDDKTPTIFLAQTLIHEAIHANLYATVKKLNGNIAPVDTSFEALYEDYRELQEWQHEYMADHYTDIMQEAIREVHPYLNDDAFLTGYDGNTMWDWDEFYKYISYRGLTNTEAGEDYFDTTNNISLYQEDTKTNSINSPNCD